MERSKTPITRREVLARVITAVAMWGALAGCQPKPGESEEARRDRLFAGGDGRFGEDPAQAGEYSKDRH